MTGGHGGGPGGNRHDRLKMAVRMRTVKHLETRIGQTSTLQHIKLLKIRITREPPGPRLGPIPPTCLSVRWSGSLVAVAYRRRNSVGVQPVHRRKARAKTSPLSYPKSLAMASSLSGVETSKWRACCIRSEVRCSIGLRPNSRRHAWRRRSLLDPNTAQRRSRSQRPPRSRATFSQWAAKTGSKGAG